jgi:anti-sigma regulatory factor (Ser/Thr protein kinase)
MSELSLRIRATPQAPSIARRAVNRLLVDNPVPPAKRDMLILLVSEVVTNAVIHPGLAHDADVEMSVVVDDDLSRVVVSDQGDGFPESADVLLKRQLGGYGLMLLNAGASRWGTLKAPQRFSVWFELDHVVAPRVEAGGDDQPAASRT